MKSFTPLILIGLAIASFFMYIKPTFSEIQDISAKKDRYTNILEKSKELISKRDEILSQYNSISPNDIDRLKKVIPDNFSSIDIARHINTVAARYGMVIKGIKITESSTGSQDTVLAPTQAEKLNEISVTFSFKGSYDQFVNFVKDLELGLYLIDIQRLSINSTGDIKNPNSTSYEFGIDLKTYSLH